MSIASAPRDVTEPTAPEHPSWRMAVRTQLRCWFGAGVALVAVGPMFVLGSMSGLLPLVGMFAAAALLATLSGLVIETLSGRRVPTGGHVLLAGAALAIVVALLTTSPGWAAIGAIVGLAAAGLGVILLPARSSWRRVVLVLAIALVVGVLTRLGVGY